MTPVSFHSALPVWETGMEKEKNLTLLFTANVAPLENVTVRIAAHCSYVLRVNGRFVAHGPARAGHGFYRVDEHGISVYLTREVNVVSVLVAGYNVNSFCYLDMPSFLCCEITEGDRVLAATGRCGFTASRYTEKVQKVQRYSFQRTFAEMYNYTPEYDRRLTDLHAPFVPVPLSETAAKAFIAREVPYPEYEPVSAAEIMERGSVRCEKPEEYYTDRYVNKISPILKGFAEDELECNTLYDAQELVTVPEEKGSRAASAVSLSPGSYVTYRLPSSLTGFLSLTAETKEDVTIYITFDEVYNGGKVNMTRLGCSNVVVWHLAGGAKYELMTHEPYTMQYMNVIAVGGGASVEIPTLIRYDFPSREITNTVKMPDDVLQTIYDAAVETFRQNTLDIYMDCPSRERAGWLCDSFFTARTEYALTGKSTVEHAFLDNFLMPESFEFLPVGMLPMCYPADHNDGTFIPNWAMWFVLELEEYLERTGDRELVDRARDRVYGLLEYFRGFENEDGLLEKLESWVFLEWSHSNDLVQDISYPSNMLYAKMLDTAAELYGDSALSEKSAALKETIRRQSYRDGFFCDNAVRGADGRAVLSGEVTESCQYYAFFSGTATPETYPELWETLVEDFGPDRVKNDKYPHIAASCPFIGNYLRLELLFRRGIYDKVEENIRGFFGYMAEKTGTLWENAGDYASCNHGFASHVVCWLNKMYG